MRFSEIHNQKYMSPFLKFLKLSNMVQNGPKWFTIVQNHPELSKDPNWFSNVNNDPIWPKMVHNEPEWFKNFVQNFFLLLNGPK